MRLRLRLGSLSILLAIFGCSTTHPAPTVAGTGDAGSSSGNSGGPGSDGGKIGRAHV